MIETLAGSAPFQAPAKATSVGIGTGGAFVQDVAGNLYIATGNLGVVLRVDTASNVTIYAGQPLPQGPALASGDGGPATAARLLKPYGLALDASGNLYISDSLGSCVRVVDAKTGVIQTVAGVPNQLGYTGDGGPATKALLGDPESLALDGAGDLFIGNRDGVIREVNLTSGVIQTFLQLVYTGSCEMTATQSCPVSGLAITFDPGASTLAARNGQLYIAVANINSGEAYRPLIGGIVSVDLASGLAQLIAGGGPSAGISPTYPADESFISAGGIAMDAAGNLFYTDVPTEQVWEYAAASHTVTAVAGNNGYGYAGDGGPSLAATLSDLGPITVSPQGNILFWDGYRIRSFAPGGNIATVAGDGTPNWLGDGGPSTLAKLAGPQNMAADAQGDLYIADSLNAAVRKVDGVSGVITTVAGQPKVTGSIGSNQPATQAQLGATSVALDNSDHLYIGGSYGLSSVDLKTGVYTILIPFVSPTTLADGGQIVFDGDKTLYAVTTYNGGPFQVSAIDVTTNAIRVVAGSGIASPDGPTGDGGPATLAGLNDIAGLALDSQGNLYLSDPVYNNIRIVNLATGIIETLAGQSSTTSGYAGDGGPATAAQFGQPTSLAYDGANHLFVNDELNSVVRVIDLTSKIITTVAGNHVNGFSGDGSSATGAMLFYPWGVTVDPQGNLYIADTYNERIRRVILHPSPLTAALTSSTTSANVGDSVTLTATYSGLSFGVAPTGSVTFTSGATLLGTGTLSATTGDPAHFVATLTTTALPAGADSPTAQYGGDAHYAAGTSNAVAIAVAGPAPSYSISASAASLSIQQGASGSITFKVTPQNGFNQAVSFSCDGATLPKGVTCSFAPASVTPTGSTPITSTLTIRTTDAAASAAAIHALPVWWLPGGGGAVFALLLWGAPRTRRNIWLSRLALMLFAIGAVGAIGCGGNSSPSAGGSQSATSTPPGTYSVKIDASTAVGTNTAAQPLTVSLTVTP